MDTFNNYPEPIQRADAIRYFVLAYFGGIYIDLDDVSLHLTHLASL
jgi:mannosyltransferase OCH1-like enzyme